MPSSNIVAYNAYSTQFKNFGNTHKSLPKESESIAEQSLPEAVVAALKKRLAQNKRISALCLEQYEKGLFPDYAAIKVEFCRKMKLHRLVVLVREHMVIHKCIHLHLVPQHIIHPLHNCKISVTLTLHCRKILKALGGKLI